MLHLHVGWYRCSTVADVAIFSAAAARFRVLRDVCATKSHVIPNRDRSVLLHAMSHVIPNRDWLVLLHTKSHFIPTRSVLLHTKSHVTANNGN
jgi:hypothetical protein